ncbi:HET-domain-containing protein [Cadophora sp. DSE1049]|nr:HET-domain-containing protein [Cadophora sp. DSE1049]
MRLLNSTNVELEEFPEDRIPKYAILSHRWQDDEVSLQDIQSTSAKKKAGYAKLKLCCGEAAKGGLQYIWVDTCCIDKTSSAELSESINSMYRWYQNAAVCYAYLFDVPSKTVSNDSSFGMSAWFTRGWTLQELIAPSNVEFYNTNWHKLGTKESLKDTISAITGIDVEVLEGVDLEYVSIAKRMSWASKRITTRVEDIAYSLLGLFGVSMPMLYGEGGAAFIRLQQEILKDSDDTSIFAWSSTNNGYRGLLAKSPSDFRDCYNIATSSSRLNRIPYSTTNMGLSIELFMIPWAMDTYLAALDCEMEDIPNSRVGIFLRLLPENDQCARVLLDGTDRLTFGSELIPHSQYRKIYVRQKVWSSRPPMDMLYGFWLRKLPLTVSLRDQWDGEERILKIPTGSRGTAGTLRFELGSRSYTLAFGFDAMFNPWYSFDGSYSFGDGRGGGGGGGTFTGDRLAGYNKKHDPTRITKEVVGNQRMWVVDIESLIDHYEDRFRLRRHSFQLRLC